MAESNVLKRVMLKCSSLLATVFRNNTGTGWVGDVFRPSRPVQILVTPADVVIRNARPLHSGLCKGSSDIIGWLSITVTHAMVGRKIAVFLALEVKDKGAPTDDQLNFVDRARAAGAIAGIVYSPEEAAALLDIVSSN